MDDDWTVTDAFTDTTGKRVSIAHAGGLVRFAVLNAAGQVDRQVVLDGARRDRFDQAYIAASHAAEARQEVRDA